MKLPRSVLENAVTALLLTGIFLFAGLSAGYGMHYLSTARTLGGFSFRVGEIAIDSGDDPLAIVTLVAANVGEERLKIRDFNAHLHVDDHVVEKAVKFTAEMQSVGANEERDIILRFRPVEGTSGYGALKRLDGTVDAGNLVLYSRFRLGVPRWDYWVARTQEMQIFGEKEAPGE